MAGSRRKVKARTYTQKSRDEAPTKVFRGTSSAELNKPKPSYAGMDEFGLLYHERRLGKAERRSVQRRTGQLGTKTTAKKQPAFEVTAEQFKGIPKSGRAKVLSSTKGTKTLKDRRRKGDRRK